MNMGPRARTQVTWLLALITVHTVVQSFPPGSGRRVINVNGVSFVWYCQLPTILSVKLNMNLKCRHKRLFWALAISLNYLILCQANISYQNQSG